jgi:hypothetical protein
MAKASKGPSYTTQLIGSLLAAAIIVLLAVALVTAKIGPGLDAREVHDLDLDEIYEDRREGDEDNSGPGN